MSGTFLVSRGVRTLVTDVSATDINPASGALAVDNNLRIASLSIAVYEYVTIQVNVSATPHSDLLAAAISSLSLLKFGYTRLRVDVGKKQVILGRADHILTGTQHIGFGIALALYFSFLLGMSRLRLLERSSTCAVGIRA